jgi:tetratricopeptide (TPR) repeat protein
MGCGKAWYVLGNAYMACYFNSAEPPRLTDLHSALKAYRRAADAPVQPQAGCADLHYNMGVVLQYVLRYTEGAHAFAAAHALAPELGAAAQRHALCAFGRKCADAVRLRGHVPKKRLQQLERALRSTHRPPTAAAAIAGRALADCGVAELCEGANDGVALSATVVAELVPASGTPISYVLVDCAGAAILLCAYDTVPDAIQLYQTLTVLAPSKRTLAIPADPPGGGAAELRVDCLVVEEPVSRLLVQGKALERAHVGRARVTSTTAYSGGTAAEL